MVLTQVPPVERHDAGQAALDDRVNIDEARIDVVLAPSVVIGRDVVEVIVASGAIGQRRNVDSEISDVREAVVIAQFAERHVSVGSSSNVVELFNKMEE